MYSNAAKAITLGPAKNKNRNWLGSPQMSGGSVCSMFAATVSRAPYKGIDVTSARPAAATPTLVTTTQDADDRANPCRVRQRTTRNIPRVTNAFTPLHNTTLPSTAPDSRSISIKGTPQETGSQTMEMTAATTTPPDCSSIRTKNSRPNGCLTRSVSNTRWAPFPGDLAAGC